LTGAGGTVVGVGALTGLAVVRTGSGATGLADLEVVFKATTGTELIVVSVLVGTGAIVGVPLMGTAEVVLDDVVDDTTAGTSGCGAVVDGVDTAEVGVLAPDLFSVVFAKAATSSRAPTTVLPVQAASLFPLLHVGGWEETAKGWSGSVTLPVRSVNRPASRMTTVG